MNKLERQPTPAAFKTPAGPHRGSRYILSSRTAEIHPFSQDEYCYFV